MAVTIAGSLGIVRCEAAPLQAAPGVEPGLLCRDAIQQAEIGTQLPSRLMGAIAHVESGRPDPATGRVHPWPWTINAEGQGKFFETKAEAIAYTRQLQARGVQSIDVGCMQINLMFHPDAFQTLEEAFDPAFNARYAAKFLTELRDKTGNWETASAWYHSANPEEGAPYRDKVLTVLASEAKGSPFYGMLPGPMASPVGVPALPAMFAARSNVIMLPRPSTGGIAARLNAFAAGVKGSSTGPILLTAGTLPPARGLDAYRLQPVRALSFVASR
jgi:hypothetical protein